MRALILAAALLPFVVAKNGTSCNVTEPFAIPYSNVTVIDTPSTIHAPHKALGLIFGGARKLLAMGMGTTANSTFVPDSDKLCNPDSPQLKGCIFWRGGVFSQAGSSTWAKDRRTSDYNGSASNDGWDYLNGENYKLMGEDPLTDFTRGWDNVDLGDKTLSAYPFSIIENSTFPFGTGMVGLASDSVFLRSATASQVSPSRSWGFHYGTNGDNEAPGELVVGGYNTAKATYKDFTNYTIFPDKSKPCPLQVNVQSMKWGNTDLMAGQGTFMACLEPAYWTMILPLKVQENWNSSMINDNNYAFWEQTWEYFKYNDTADSSFPNGELVITLDKGFTVNIPRTELFETAKAINQTAGGWISQPDHIQTKVGTAGFPPGVEPLIPFFGGPFLSQVYLAVDYENMIFSLANMKGQSTGTSGLRQLGCDDVPPAADSDPGKNNTGAIVGGSVGGVLGLLAILGAVFYFFFYRKRKAQPATYAPAAAVEDKKDHSENVPRYTSPYQGSPYGAYPPPPPTDPGSSPYPTYSSHYSDRTAWSTSPPPPMPAQFEDAVMLPASRLDPVEIGSGVPETPTSPHNAPSPPLPAATRDAIRPMAPAADAGRPDLLT